MARKSKQANKQHFPRKKKKGARDIFIRFLALTMVIVMLVVIIIPVYGPLKELFNAVGKQLAPFTQTAAEWLQNTFSTVVNWVQSFF